MNKKYTVSNSFNVEMLAGALCDFLINSKKMTAQSFNRAYNEYVVQAKDDSMIKKVSGMDKALTVTLKIEGNILAMQTGEGQWVTHAAAKAVGWFVFWPLLVTGAIGSYTQHQLPKEIDLFVSNYINTTKNQAYEFSDIAEQAVSSQFCPNCGKKLLQESNFCDGCGSKIK